MTWRNLATLTAPLALAGALMVAVPAVSHAANCDQGTKTGNPNCPDPGATPELGSVVLFGTGALALAGLALVQRRRHPGQ